jgi:hypothetical protein
VLRSSASARPMVLRAGGPLMESPPNVAPNAQQPPPPDPAALDVQFVQNFVAPLTVGVAVERFRSVTMVWQGHSLGTDTAYWAYLKGLGVTHVRLNQPWRVSTEMYPGWSNGTQPTDAQLDQMLLAAQKAVAAGLKVLYDCTDTLSAADFNNRTAIEQVVDRTAAKVAVLGAALPPASFAIGPYFELDFPTNADCNTYRLAAHTILRTRLPSHVLITGAALNNSPTALTASDWSMVQDRRVILKWHDYPGLPTANYLQVLLGKYNTLSQQNGGVPIIGCLAAVGTHDYEAAWSQLLQQYAAYQPLVRPCLWTVTDGQWFNIAVSTSDPTLRSDIEFSVKKSAAIVQNDAGWLSANPTVNPPPIPADPVTTPAPSGGPSLSMTPSSPGTLASGAAFNFTITSSGISNVTYVVVNPNYSWVNAGTAVATSGSVNASVTFTQTGQFVKVFDTNNTSTEFNSDPVTISGGTTAPPPTSSGANVWFEGFDNNNSGKLDHTWGHTQSVSYSNGILRIEGDPNLNPDATAAGVMGQDGISASTWFGYGLYEFRIRYTGGKGNGSGPAVGLWPATGGWPGPEIDVGEVDDRGFYCAHHWHGGYRSDGSPIDAYNLFYKDGLDWWNWHTSAVNFTPGRLEFFVDGVSIGGTTSNVTPAYVDGGENRIPFTMNRSSNTTLECDWIRYTPS